MKNTYKKVIKIFIVVSFLILFLTQSVSAEGTYQIYTLEDLNNIRNDLSGDYTLMNDIDASPTSSWNDGAGWMPVGNDSAPFNGTFDGYNYKINNLHIDGPETEKIGFFGLTRGARIENVKLENVNITGKETLTTYRHEIIGGLIGQMENTEVVNCHTSGKITTKYYFSSNKAAGLIGYATYEDPRVSSRLNYIGYSTSSCDIYGRDGAGFIFEAEGYGVVATCPDESYYYEIGYEEGVDLIIEHCSATGNVNTYRSGAGFVFYSYNTKFIDCFATGRVGTIGNKDLEGGGFGYEVWGCKFERCYSTGTVEGRDFLGGFLSYGDSIWITECYSDSRIIGHEGLAHGGLIGELTSNYEGVTTIENSYATGMVTQDSNPNGYVGGLIGMIQDADSSNITNCYSVGFVQGESPFGGMIGNMSGSNNIIHCYYDQETSGQTDNDGRGYPRTTSEMKTQSNYVDWDFDDIWAFSSEVNDGYPYLQRLESDATLPYVTITSPSYGSVTTSSVVTISGTATDDVGIDAVTVNGVLASGTTSWSATISLLEGENIVDVVVRDLEGNEVRDFTRVYYYIDDNCHPLFAGTSQVEVGGTYYLWYKATPYSEISIESEYLTYTQPDENGIFNVSVDTKTEGFSEGIYDISASSVTLSIGDDVYDIDPSMFDFSLEVLPRDYSTSWYISEKSGGGCGFFIYEDNETKKDFKLTVQNQDTNLIMNRLLDSTLTYNGGLGFGTRVRSAEISVINSDVYSGSKTMVGSQLQVDYENAPDSEKLKGALYILTSVADSQNPLLYKTIDAVTNQIETDLSLDYYESGVATVDGAEAYLLKAGLSAKDENSESTSILATLANIAVGYSAENTAACIKNRFYPEENYQECSVQYTINRDKDISASILSNEVIDWGEHNGYDATVIIGNDEYNKMYGKKIIRDNVYSDEGIVQQKTYDYGEITESNIANPFGKEDIEPEKVFSSFCENTKDADSGNISIQETKDDSYNVGFPIEVKIGPAKYILHDEVTFGTANNYLTEKQLIFGKNPYIVEMYSYDSHVDSPTQDLITIFKTLLEPVGNVLKSVVNILTVEIGSASTVMFSDGSLFIPHAVEGNVSIISFGTSEPETMTFQMFSTMGLFSSYVTSMSGDDFAIGNITDLQPYNVTLDQEATLTLNYEDSGIADETNISIYKWNDSQNAWLPLDSVINQSANEAETNISSFGTFTAGYDQTSPVMQWNTSTLHLDRISAKARITDSGSGVNSSAIYLYLDDVPQNFTYNIFSGMLTSTMETSVGEHVVKIYSEDTSGNFETLEVNVSVIEPVEITDMDVNFQGSDSIVVEWEYESGTYPLDYFVVLQNNEVLENTTMNNFSSTDFIGSTYGIYPVDTFGNFGRGAVVTYRRSQLVPLFFYEGNSSFLPTVGTPVTFNASDSYVTKGTIETNISNYTWIFNDDTANATSGKIVNHVFDSEGLNKILLIVEDEQQNNATLMRVIDVANKTQTSEVLPLINFVAPTADNASIISENYMPINVTVESSVSQNNTTAFIDWNNSLVGWWRFDNDNGTLVEDYSIHQKTGIMHNMDTSLDNGTSGWTTEGKFGNAMRFDGLDARVEMLDDSVYDIPIQGDGKITMEAWVYPLNLTYESGILSKRSNYRMVIRSGGELKFQSFGWTGGGVSSKVKENEWSHIAITYDGETDQLKFYLNGNNVRTVDLYLPNGGTNSNNLWIGRGHDYLTMPTFNGTIDEVRLWKRSLNPEEIKASYNSGLYRLETNITGLEDGIYTYTAHAQDIEGNVNQTETRTITIDTYVNNAPVLDPIGDIVIDENQVLLLNLSAADDEDGLTYSVSYPTNDTFGNLSGNMFTWTPSASDVGVHYLTFSVSDGSLSDNETISITVNNASPFNGDGTESNPYQITNVNELQSMNQELSAHYVLMNDIDASETSTWNNGAGFEPIGNSTMRFTGSFDGKNCTISDLYINRPSTDIIGLFGYVYGTYPEDGICTIKYLTLENASVVGNYLTGGLIGKAESSGIYQCNVFGHIEGNYYTGGLVGFHSGGDIIKSHSNGTITGTYTVGGLAGLNGAGIRNSYSTGLVNGISAVGGLVGANFEVYIINSHSNGTVTGISSVGGLVGSNGGGIRNSYSTSPVNGEDYIGGLVGFNAGGIEESYACGPVNGTTNVGGLVAMEEYSIVTSSYWDTEASGQSTSYGGTGKTTAEMQNQSTFVGWDFTDTWSISGQINNGYPFLL
ncbi:LamG-like jellyroll fold domain-containing protein [Methanolobus sp. ZRKC2]|uniref:LamG-like jellyroll fold domain-containing protein n=1 Tax=Methanolobus sp. ZRKC2 TaxID=3125783 RepID=UPI003253A980